MTRFRRMEEESRRPGARQRGGNFPRDVAGFSHAGHDDPTLATQA